MNLYSKEKIAATLKIYHQCGSVTTTVRILGYPTKRAFYTWIANDGVSKPEHKSFKLINSLEHPHNPLIEVKTDAIHRCFEQGKSIKSVSEGISYTRTSIYSWRKKYLLGGNTALMNNKNIKLGILAEGRSASTPDLAQLQT